MLCISVPDEKDLELKNAVFDFNGTLASGGKLSNTVKLMLPRIKEKLTVYILSSDTFGTISEQCSGLGVEIKVVNGGAAKGDFVKQLGAENTVCIGNGNNDIDMFCQCALSILVMGDEGCSKRALILADIVVKNIKDALNLLIDPSGIIATLRG